MRDVTANGWAKPLYSFPSKFDYRIMHGGRGSSKTTEVTQALIALGHLRPLRIAVAREHKVSISESAQPELVDRAKNMGLFGKHAYRSTRVAINHANGTHIFFIGLSVMSEEDIRGLSQLDLLWIEEAHRLSRSSWNLVYPTVRKEDSEIWLTFNPKYRTDVAWELAQLKDDPQFWIKEVNWRDNKHFTPKNNRDRLRDKKNHPLLYPHIWEGEPDDVSAARKVLSYDLLRTCVDMYDKRPIRGSLVMAGFDVADTGQDSNALALRSGPDLFEVEEWKGSDMYTVSDSTRHVAKRCKDEHAVRMFYDGGGPGSGVRGPWRESGIGIRETACLFGGQVQSPDISFIRGRRPQTNAQYFAKWGAQAGWVLRMRAEMTRRLANGEKVNPDDCLFINPKIKNLERVLAQLAQPEWMDDTGKLRIEKKPRGPGEPEPPSPDAYDACVLAFSYDARRGLTQR